MIRAYGRVVLAGLTVITIVSCSNELAPGGGTRADSTSISVPGLRLTTGPTGGHVDFCYGFDPNCAYLVHPEEGSPYLFDAHPGPNIQLDPLTYVFPSGAKNLLVRLQGGLPCQGSHGVVAAFDASGASLGEFPFQIDDPSDCGDDDLTGRASVFVSTSRPVSKVVIASPSPMSYLMPEHYRINMGYPPGTLIYGGELRPNFSFDWTIQAKLHLKIEYPVGTPVRPDGTPVVLPAGIRRGEQQYDSTIGRPPYWQGKVWQDTVLVVAQLDSSGVKLSGRQVAISVTAVDSAGRSIDSVFGHDHTDTLHPKPAGRVRRSTLTTGVAGRDSTTFFASEVSGPVVVRVTAPGADTAVDTLWVGVSGLEQVVPSAHYDTTGGVPIHPYGHNVWVTSGMLDTLGIFADSVFVYFGQSAIFNDASLPFGGKFDLDQQWDRPDPACQFRWPDGTLHASPGGCHQTHRTGWDTDLKIIGQFDGVDQDEKENLRILTRLWRSISCSKAINEGNHIHLALREGGRLRDNTIPACIGEE